MGVASRLSLYSYRIKEMHSIVNKPTAQAGTPLAVSAALATFHLPSQEKALGAQAGLYKAPFLTHAFPKLAA